MGHRILPGQALARVAMGAAVTKDGNTSVPHFAEPVPVVQTTPTPGRMAGSRNTGAACGAGRRAGKRDDKSTLYTAETVQDIGVHAYYDVLRIAPTGRLWSVWAMFAEHTKEFAGRYVNLEDPHVRDEHAVYTSDHVLDLEIEPERTMARNDEDELALAVAQGRYDAATAAEIEADAAEVETIVAD